MTIVAWLATMAVTFVLPWAAVIWLFISVSTIKREQREMMKRLAELRTALDSPRAGTEEHR